jgi:hypothetical protein
VIKLYALMSVISFALVIFCVIDIIGTPAHRARNLPKLWWLLLVLFFPFVGSIAWLAAGRPQQAGRPARSHERELPEFPEYNRPGRAAAADPAKDEEFLRQVRERAEEQRKRYEASRKQEPPAEPEPEPEPEST